MLGKRLLGIGRRSRHISRAQQWAGMRAYDPACAGDQSRVATLLSGMPVSPQGTCRESLPRPSAGTCRRGCPVVPCARVFWPLASKYFSSKLATSTSWILPRLWSKRNHLEPFGLWRPPIRQLARFCRGACPTRRLLAAVFIAMLPPSQLAFGRGRGRPRTRSGALGRIGHPLLTRQLRSHGGHRCIDARQRRISTPLIAFELLVLMTALRQVAAPHCV